MKRSRAQYSRQRVKTSRVHDKNKRVALRQEIRKHRQLHVRIMLHPAYLMMLLATGVVVLSLTFRSVADSYSITGKVPAPPLTSGASITDPTNGANSSTSPMSISGTCPNNSYVKLTGNGIFSGSAGCTANTFTILTSLSAGANSLVAQDYNITDDTGPATPAITLIYQPPVVPTNPTKPGISYQPTPEINASPVLLTSSYQFRPFTSGSSFTWDVQVSGGQSPYTIRIDWGDDSVTSQQVPTAQTFTIAHTYKKPGYYAITLYVNAADKSTTLLQLAAFVRLPGTPIGSISTPANSDSASESMIDTAKRWLWVIWPTYLVLALMAISYWLGEREELHMLKHPQKNWLTHRFHQR